MDYRVYYILSFFQKDRPTSSSQILHIFHGKRTPSMFYIAERNGWHHAFAQFKNSSEESLDKVIQVLLQNKWIEPADKGFKLTDVGDQVCQAFYKDRYYPQVSTFTNLMIRKNFWDRYQLFVQTFSEMHYANNRYTPIIKHPHHQENVRLLFQQFHQDRALLKEMWLKEQTFLFEQLDESRANILAAQLTGHKIVGGTKGQMQEQLSMSPLEYLFYHEDTIDLLLHAIQEHPDELPILHAMMSQMQGETHDGLSMSTYETYELLGQGHSVSEIAGIRRLKENTIREHILELAFMRYDFPYTAFVPEAIYNDLHQAFREKNDYQYREAKEDFEDLEFLYFRLVELERMRSDVG